MIERICPACQHGNPLDDRFCGKCGAALERQLPMQRPDSRLAIAGRNLPVTWQQLGKTVALSVAALAAEAGVAWLRRRIESGPAAPVVAPRTNALARTSAPESAALAPTGGRIVTIISQRVVEIWDDGASQRRVVERNFWRRIDE